MSESHRVLFVIPGAARGSSMIFARRQATSLVDLGVEVRVFHLRSRTSPAKVAAEFLRFRRVLRRFQPNVIHAQFGTATAMFSALAAGRCPLVITFRGGDLNPVPSAGGFRPAVGRILSQLAALRAARIVCVSRGLRDRLWWRRDRAVVLASGVDLGLFRPEPRHEVRLRLGWPDQERVVLFNAGHDPINKRLDLARAAVGQAGQKIPSMRLEILNGGVAPEMVPAFMNAADCLLVTSDSEGSPTVVQEALASNLPIVSVDAGDVAERLEGVAHSSIVERDPSALARALVELVTHPVRSDGRQRVESFSSQTIARELSRLYGEILRERRN